MSSKVILLVEDNPDDEELALLAFRKSKLANEVIVVRDGEEALLYLLGDGVSEPKILPQVVLLDLKLPKIDGHEVLKRIRSDTRTQRLPIVILTSSREDEDVVRGYNLGANSYVRKPVDFDGFIEAIRQLQVYWLILNEAPPLGY
ncbi:Response regulator rcp1 [Pirellula sp. SH-Sr6A]|uniref:response regulator n=1 Tax=Pirellula sp. SH-Sr6A TaxID=1632865 RepID=UPI00078B8606|nr:response regulator [Pirellula sp. SH-Sr6A]AMV31385.1 Response regulator rcp1 [Pirellula sp. SH-Sr6A]